MRTLEALPSRSRSRSPRRRSTSSLRWRTGLGIHSIKWELEDLAFSSLHPRKYTEIKSLVSQQRTERESYVERAGRYPMMPVSSIAIR